MGAGTHFIGQGKGNPDSLTDILRQAGATTIRDEISWGQVETQPSVLSVPPAQDEYVRSAVASGLDVLIILDYGNRFYDQGERPTSEAAMAAFTRYATFMAKHFRGVVNKFEIWNEWDIPIGGVTGPGDPADYMRLVRTVSVALKEVDPNITVVAGAMTNAAMYNGFLDGTLAGGLLQHCDVVSAHPYNWGEELQARRPEAWLTRMDWLQSKLRDHNGGRDFPVYVTEMGWPTQIDERGIATNRAGAHCARMYLLAATLPYLKGLWWYDLQDDGWGATEPEDNFGLIRADETPKPSYYSYAAAAAFLRGARFPASHPNSGRRRMGTVLLVARVPRRNRALERASGRRLVRRSSRHPRKRQRKTHSRGVGAPCDTAKVGTPRMVLGPRRPHPARRDGSHPASKPDHCPRQPRWGRGDPSDQTPVPRVLTE